MLLRVLESRNNTVLCWQNLPILLCISWMLERFSFDVGRQFICPFLVIGWVGGIYSPPPSPSHIHGSDLSLGRIEHVVSHWLVTHEVKNNVSAKMKKRTCKTTDQSEWEIGIWKQETGQQTRTQCHSYPSILILILDIENMQYFSFLYYSIPFWSPMDTKL